ncbi:MAG: PEGA domain-containing protein [Verrucomicrobiota bacterium]
MKLFRVGASVLAIACFPACASIVSGTHKSVYVTSEPSGALVKLDGETRAITPAVLHPSLRSNHTVTIELAGYQPAQVRLTRKINSWEFGNIVTGIVPGLAFDAATGAIFQFDTNRIHARFRPVGAKTR